MADLTLQDVLDATLASFAKLDAKFDAKLADVQREVADVRREVATSGAK